MDLALRRRAHRVEAQKRPRRHDDAGAGLGRAPDQLLVAEQGADAQRQQDPALLDRRAGDLGEAGGGDRFHHHVRDLGQLGEAQHRRRRAQTGELGRRAGPVPGRDGDQAQPGHGGVERAGHRQADGAEAGDGDPARFTGHRRHSPGATSRRWTMPSSSGLTAG